MSAQDKQIKITLGVDADSVAKTKRAIAEITQEVNRLVEATNKVGLGFGGIGGGTGAKVGNFTGTPGNSVGSQINQRISSGGGGVTDNLTKAVQNSAQLFRGAAEGSKGAFKVMSDALKSHVRESDQEIRRLQLSLQGLERTYDRLKQRQASGLGGKLTDSAVSEVGDRYYQTADQLDRARKDRKKFERAQEKLEEEHSPSLMQRVRRAFRRDDEEEKEGGGKSKRGFLGGLAQGAGFGGVTSALTSTAGAAAGGAVLGYKLYNLGKENEKANLNFNIDTQPFIRSNARAQLGQVLGGNAQAIRHGDMARVAAMVQLSKDPAFASILSPDMDKMLHQRRVLDVNGSVGGVLGYGMGMAGEAMAGLIGGGGGGSSTNAKALEFAKRRADEMAIKATMMQKQIENKIAEDPGFSDRINSFYGGAVGNAGLLRTGGMGGGNVKFHGTMIEQTSLLRARAAGQLRDAGELVGARAELAATAGRGFMGNGESILGPKTGGLHNVASILGVGAQFGGGGWAGARRFLSKVQGGIGRGGVDVTAGANLMGTTMGMMQAGNFTGTGLGLTEAMLAGGFTGTPGGDMRMSRVMGAGVGALGNVMSGGVDPLQGALNASAALSAAPNAPYSAKFALMRMDPAQRAEFERTGVVPPDMRALGVTSDMMREYIVAQTGTMFSRVNEDMVGGSAGDAMKRYRASGGLGYMKGWSRKAIEKEARDLAPALKMAGGAPTVEGALGSIRFQLASQGILKGGRGRGAHDTIRRGTAMAVAGGAQAAEEFKEGVKHAGDTDLYKGTFEAASTMENVSESTRKMAQKHIVAGGDVNDAITQVSAALSAFVTAIKRDVTGAAPGMKAGARR